MDEHSLTYTTASGVWRRGGVIKIYSAFETLIATFPVDFVRDSGDNTWLYILRVIAMLVEVDQGFTGRIVTRDGDDMDPMQAPVAGIFYYMEEGESSPSTRGFALTLSLGRCSDVRFVRGPQYFSSVTAPSGIEESTRSASSKASRSRPDQVRRVFSTRLTYRTIFANCS